MQKIGRNAHIDPRPDCIHNRRMPLGCANACFAGTGPQPGAILHDPYAMAAPRTHNTLHVLDEVDSLLFVIDMESREILFANRRMFEFFRGRLKAGFPCKCWELFNEGREGPCPFCMISELFRTKETFPVCEREIYCTLKRMWFLARESVIRWDDSRYALLTQLRDITGYKLQERRLQENEVLPFEAAPSEIKTISAGSPSYKDAATHRPVFVGRVLICEDDLISQVVLKEHLRRLGLFVDIAEDGQQAVQRVKEGIAAGQTYDLILMDLQMPVMDGMEAAGILHTMGNTTPILAVTAGMLPDERLKCRQNGISGFIFKPFRMQELYNCLSTYLPAPAPSFHEAAEGAAGGATAFKVIDWEEGLASALGNPDFYKHQLASFYQENQNCYDTLCHALQSGDAAHPHRIAHSLGSTSRLIGARRLEAAAHALDLALQEGVPNPSQALQALQTELTLVLNAIRPQLPATAALPEPADPLQSFADELDAQLRAKRASTVAYVDRIEKIFAKSGDLCKKLTQHILAYDFVEARKVLAQLRSPVPR